MFVTLTYLFLTMTRFDSFCVLTVNKKYSQNISIKQLYLGVFFLEFTAWQRRFNTLKRQTLSPAPRVSDSQTLKTHIASVCTLQADGLTRTSCDLMLD